MSQNWNPGLPARQTLYSFPPANKVEVILSLNEYLLSNCFASIFLGAGDRKVKKDFSLFHQAHVLREKDYK